MCGVELLVIINNRIQLPYGAEPEDGSMLLHAVGGEMVQSCSTFRYLGSHTGNPELPALGIEALQAVFAIVRLGT